MEPEGSKPEGASLAKLLAESTIARLAYVATDSYDPSDLRCTTTDRTCAEMFLQGSSTLILKSYESACCGYLWGALCVGNNTSRADRDWIQHGRLM